MGRYVKDATARRAAAHCAFFLDDEEKDRAVALMRRVEAGVQDSMSYCINRAVSISYDSFARVIFAGVYPFFERESAFHPDK